MRLSNIKRIRRIDLALSEFRTLRVACRLTIVNPIKTRGISATGRGFGKCGVRQTLILSKLNNKL